MGTTYNYKMFGCFTRKFKVNEVRPPVDVNDVFERYADDGGCMTTAQLRRFLVEVQGMNQAEAESESKRIVDQISQKRKPGLVLDDFFCYLFDADLNGPMYDQVHNDMNAPLQHYFIYTGHNSYLTGNQLSSDCSEVPIIKALQRGVRVIELDIWPNSTKDNINVLHGRTLTTPVPFTRCLRSIKNHAFEASPYPVIITLEDHLTPDLQAKAAQMVKEIFGDMLYCPDCGNVEEFPSPEQLKHKIIFSTKPPKEYLESKQNKEKEEGSVARSSSEGGESVSECTAEDEAVDESDNDPDPDDEENDRSSTASEYKRLIAIRAGKPKNGLKEALTDTSEKVRRLSLSEQGLLKAALEYPAEVVRFTKKNFLRIYPKGTRIGSSNYHPMVGWSHGAQMVAFNMQGFGSALWLMHGMFRSNGGCGYVKKPDILLTKTDPGAENEVFDPKVSLPVKKRLKVLLYLSGGWHLDFSKTHFDAYSPPDFYTKLQVVGVAADCIKHKTKVIEDDWAPNWDEEFIFNLTVPELALLRVVVKERDVSEKDDFGGQTCLPVCEIKQGFRAVALFDKKGDKLPNTKLFMRFDFI